MKDIKGKNKLFKLFLEGVVGGFIGQFIGDFIIGIIANDEEINLITVDEGYVAAIISGGVSSVIAIYVDDFKQILMSVGIYYVVFQALLEATNQQILTQDDLLKEFITDVIIIYIIVKLKKEFIAFFLNKKITNQEDFFNAVLFNLINGIVISGYFSVKRYINK